MLSPVWCFWAVLLLVFRCLYGGASKLAQGRQLQQGPQLIIATPGRLLDFVNTGEANLSRVSAAASLRLRQPLLGFVVVMMLEQLNHQHL